MTTVGKPRKWFDFDALELEGVEGVEGVHRSTGVADPIVLSPYAGMPSGPVYVERRTGDFCGCCGNCGNPCRGCGNCCGLLNFCKTETLYDEFGRPRTRTLCCGLGVLNWIGLVLYLTIIVCAMLLLWATTLLSPDSSSSGAANSTLVPSSLPSPALGLLGGLVSNSSSNATVGL